MTMLLSLSLIAHVLIGIIGVAASYTVVMLLLKRTLLLSWIRWAATVAFVSYFLSWLTGGYYYVVRYGSEVKPVIKSGAYPWAHSIVTESKEHVFLFLPVLAALTMLVALFLGTELTTNRALRRAMIGVAAVTFVLGLLIALAGVIVSGSVR